MVVVCIQQIGVLTHQKKCCGLDDPDYEPKVVAAHSGGDTVAVRRTGRKVCLYSILCILLKDKGKLLKAKAL